MLERETNGKILAAAQRVRLPLGDELEGESQCAIAVGLARRTRQDETLRAACKQFMRRGPGLVATGARRRDFLQTFLLEVLVELLRREFDRARIAAIADHEQ